MRGAVKPTISALWLLPVWRRKQTREDTEAISRVSVWGEAVCTHRGRLNPRGTMPGAQEQPPPVRQIQARMAPPGSYSAPVTKLSFLVYQRDMTASRGT